MISKIEYKIIAISSIGLGLLVLGLIYFLNLNGGI